MGDFSVSLNNFHFSQNHPHTIKFDAYSTASKSVLFSFDFIGTEIVNEGRTIPEDIKKQLKDALQEDFGMGPYTRGKIKTNFNKCTQHYVFNFQD